MYLWRENGIAYGNLSSFPFEYYILVFYPENTKLAIAGRSAVAEATWPASNTVTFA